MSRIHPEAAARGAKDYFTEKVEFVEPDGSEKYYYNLVVNAFSPEALRALLEYVFKEPNSLEVHSFEKIRKQHIASLNRLTQNLDLHQYKAAKTMAERAREVLEGLTFEPQLNKIQIPIMKFYDNDPEKGGKEISFWEHLERSGSLARFKEKGFIVNPVHNYELLKEYRKENFEKALEGFKQERALNKVETTESDVRGLRVMWLNKELQVAEKWLQDSQSNSDRLELVKYLQSVEEERNELINERTTPEKSKQKLAVKHHVLTYLFECHAKQESYPIGLKKELERIGQQRMKGKSGNTFYKQFGELCEKNILDLKTLFEIGGDNWREIVLSLTSDREKVEAFLVSKGL